MNHGHSPALPPETNRFHLRTNTEIGEPRLSRKWVPKTPGKNFAFRKTPWHDGWKGMCILPNINLTHPTKQKHFAWKFFPVQPAEPSTINQTLDQQDSGKFLPYFRTWCLAMKLQEIDVICPQMGKAFSAFLLKKNFNPKYLNLIFSKTTSFYLRF